MIHADGRDVRSKSQPQGWLVLGEQFAWVKSKNEPLASSLEIVVLINTLFDETIGPNIRVGFDARAVMREAEVMVPVDVVSQEPSLVYGRKMHTGQIPG